MDVYSKLKKQMDLLVGVSREKKSLKAPDLANSTI